MKTNNKIMIAIGSAMAFGALLGILFAPDKGSATRKKISKAADKAADKFNAMRDKIKGNVDHRDNRRGAGVENEINEYVS